MTSSLTKEDLLCRTIIERAAVPIPEDWSHCAHLCRACRALPAEPVSLTRGALLDIAEQLGGTEAEGYAGLLAVAAVRRGDDS